MTHARQLQEISFDLFERYGLLEHIGKVFRPEGSTYRVLDVGGCRAAFWPGFTSLAGVLIPEATVVVADVISVSELENYIQASGVHLPFRDGTFDLVCALDTLVHIPGEYRAAFLAEMLRVSRDGLYVSFPFDSASNRWAESIVVEYANSVLKDPMPALLENRQCGLPDRDRVTRLFSQAPHSWIAFEQGNTDVWLSMMLIYHSLRPAGADFIQELNRRFNQAYAAQDRADPAYRAAYLLSKRRSIADLEGARASFVSTEDDLQRMLSFCQLFLNIAQHGRVTVDKDRHIRNIESELKDTRAYKEKWGEAAAVLRNLEVSLLDTPRGAPLQALGDWPQDRIARLLDEVAKLRAGVRSELDNKLSRIGAQLEAQLEAIREQIDSLRIAQIAAQSEMREQVDFLRASQMAARSETREQIGSLRIPEIAEQVETVREQIGSFDGHLLELKPRLDARMRDLEIALVMNKRAIQAIYDSRIWKALSGIGAWILRLTGRSPAPNHGTPLVYREGSRTPGSAPDKSLALVCDYPSDGDILPGREALEIRGWAFASSGIDRVLIQINDDPPAIATYGISRPDVGRSHPEVAGSGQSGYWFLWDAASLPEGPCTVRVTAFAHSGQTGEVVRKVLIDGQKPAGYSAWIGRHEPGVEALRQMRLDAEKFAVRPRISMAVPVYKTPVALLTRCIESVRDQTYPDWELCMANDGSDDAALAEVLQKYQQCDSRIRLVNMEHNCGIAGATNAALHLCTGDYVAFLDHDDELAGFALSAVVQAINDHPDIDLFYSDEDKIDEQGRRYDVFFKPDWSPDLFRSCNYICHLVVMKHSLLDRLGGLNESYSGSQDYEFLLRASERTQKIRRIPQVLYHWRAVAGSAARGAEEKPEASADGHRALSAYLARNEPGAKVEEVAPCRYRVRYPIAGEPRVSILIPTGGNKSVFRALEEVLEKTTYKNYEIVLIDNSRTSRVEEYAARLTARKAPVRYFDWRGKPFNFSRMNNETVRAVASPYVLFLNDDTTIISAEWLTAMLEHAQQPEVGAVGAQLWYPNNLIQHAGVVMGLYGNCSHAFKGTPGGLPHYGDFPDLIRNCSAVTGACLLVARNKFFEGGAFDEINLAVAFQDVDLCLKLLELGYRNVYTPYAKLYHFESATKTEDEKIPDPVEDAFMKKKWAKYIADDPYYNPNLTRRGEDFSLAVD
jgi:glycosyltransferase involved in cell wall biosynthesis/SAM-dependent methyltransferase